MARQLRVELVGDNKDFLRALSGATGGANNFGSSLARLGKIAVLSAGAAGVGAVAIGLRQGIKEYIEASKVAAQTNAVIASTGGVANVTAKQVDSLATSLMKKSGIDDEAIASGENMLLTFTKVRNEVGQGNDVFNQATLAATNLSVALGKDLPSSAMLVGKALNDPVKGMTAMTRAGIQFTDAQKDTIKALVESGDVLGAQKIILKELETQFGKSAEAAGKTLPGQLNILKESFNNFAGDLVAKAVPAVQRFVDFLNTRLIPAEGFTAKLKVVWTGVSEVGGELWDKIVAAWEGDQRTIVMDLGERVEVVGEEGFKEKLKQASSDAQAGMWEKMKADSKQGVADFWREVETNTGPINAAGRMWTDTLRAAMFGGIRALAGSFNLLLKEVFVDPFVEMKSLLISAVRDIMSSFVTVFTSYIPIAAGAAVTLGSRIVSSVSGALTRIGGVVMDKLEGVITSISRTATNAFSMAVGIGSAIIGGIVSGLGGLIGRVSGAIADGVRGAIGRAGGILRGSGDYMFTKHTVGQPMAEGIIEGLAETLAGRLPKNLSSTLLTAMGAAGIDKSATDGGTGIGTSLKGGIDTFLENKLPDNLASILGLATSEAMAKMDFSQAGLGVSWTPTAASVPVTHTSPLGRSALADPDAGTIVVNIHQPIGNERQLQDMVVSALSSVRGRGGLGPS